MTIARSRRRRWIAGALATVAAAPLLATASAQASGATTAVCSPRFTLTVTPGFSLSPSSGSLTTHGETGSLTCEGTVEGARVTGPGTVSLDETYARGDCLSHVGIGTARVTLPTTAGPKHMEGAATSRRTGLALSAEVQFPGARFSGLGVAIPTQGDCVLSPLTKALVTVTGTLTGS